MWTKWHWDRFVSESSFQLSVFHQCSVLTHSFIHSYQQCYITLAIKCLVFSLLKMFTVFFILILWCLQVRVNCLVCVGKLLEHLDKWLVLDEVLPFLPQIPSREPAVLMGILGMLGDWNHILLFYDFFMLLGIYDIIQ